MNHLPYEGKTFTKGEKGFFTSAEIARQPATWDKVWKKLASQKEEITSFLQDIIAQKELNIVLTGAGSSAFIGDAVASTWIQSFSRNTYAIPTTDLVTHFNQKIITDKPLLLVSFGRSGNSPESRAVVQIAEQNCDTVYHLVITCNPDGKLAELSNRSNSYVFLLPGEAEDKSLAMTNSFTSMALAAILIPKLFSCNHSYLQDQVQQLSSYAKALLTTRIDHFKKASQRDFDRIIFLGSGSMLGIAKESHLKVQELTNGKIVGKYDSYLGFRHGPKAVINDKTFIGYLLSNDPGTHKYEKDLMDQIARHDIDLVTLAISEATFENPDIDYTISFNNGNTLDSCFWAILCTLPAQIIGFYKSLAFFHNPDNPSPNGTISRVVEGVKIYDTNIN